MPKLPSTRASDVLPDGGLKIIPGFSDTSMMLDNLPMLVHSGKLDCVTAVTEQAAHLIPFRAKLVGGRVRVRTAMGTGAAIVKVGKQGDDDYFATQSLATSDASGTVYDLTFVQTIVEKNDVITFAADGGATTNGDADITLVLVPYPS